MARRNNPAEERLEKVYFELLENSHYSKITVSDIISKAGVSRTTFYRYYIDVFDMHKKISEKLGSKIVEVCFKTVLSAKNEEECFDKVLNIFYSQEKYILLLSGANGSRYLFETIYRYANEQLFPALIHLSEDQIFRLKFMTISIIGVYVKDIIEGRGHNPKYIAICKKLLNFDELFGGRYAE